MISFFRQIRKNLMEQNPSNGRTSKTRSYLFYAIGEIALVVIGILIALQINNWNEWRKDRLKEVKILKELSENLQINIQRLNTNIKRGKIDNKQTDVNDQYMAVR